MEENNNEQYPSQINKIRTIDELHFIQQQQASIGFKPWLAKGKL